MKRKNETKNKKKNLFRPMNSERAINNRPKYINIHIDAINMQF